MKTNPKFKPAATLTIHHAAKMTKRGRRRVAAWLRLQAEQFEVQADSLAPRYTANYLCRTSGSVRRVRA